MERNIKWRIGCACISSFFIATAFANTATTTEAVVDTNATKVAVQSPKKMQSKPLKSVRHHAKRKIHASKPVFHSKQLTPEQRHEWIGRLKQWFELQKTDRPQLSFLGLYDAFKFNSTVGSSYNDFFGHTQLLNLGGGNLKYHGFRTGFGITAANTRLSSAFSAAPGNYQTGTTSIDNTVINLYASHPLISHVTATLLAGAAHSQFSLKNVVTYPTGQAVPPTVIKYGQAALSGFYEYLGGRLVVFDSWKDWRFSGDFAYVFSNFQQPAYTINYSNATSAAVPSLITRVGLLTENARLAYHVNDRIEPYIMGGLIQVANLNFSNPIIQPSTISAAPQLTLSNSGFLLGAGLSYLYKKIRISPLYQYSQRGTNYVDNLGALKIDLLC